MEFFYDIMELFLHLLDRRIFFIYNRRMREDNKNIIRTNNRESYYKGQNGDLNFYHINTTLLKDLFPIDVGYELHSEQKNFPNQYPYYLLHFVKRGRGSIVIDGNKTLMTRNTIFILPPDREILYMAKPGWEYFWINFNGIAARNLLTRLGISEERYFLRFPNSKPLKYFQEALEAKQSKRSQVFTVTHCLLAVFALIAEQTPLFPHVPENGKKLFAQIYDYIHEHLYDVNLTAGGIAQHFFISLSYFSILFKKNANTTFKEYLNYERIKKATELLESTDLSIKQVAEAVGFSDPLYFSKVFKRYRLVGPIEYRAALSQ